MNVYRTIVLTCIIAFVYCTSQVNAQVIGFKEFSTATLSLNECGKTDTIAFEIYNCCSSDTLRSISIADSLPSGISFVSVLTNPRLSNVNTGNSQVPIFTFTKLAPGKRDTLYLIIAAKCGAKTSTTAFCKYNLGWNTSGTSFTQNEIGANFYSSIYRPNMQLLPVGSVNYTNASIGNSYCRKWKVQNSGIGSTLDTVRISITYQAGLTFNSLKINGTTVSPTIIGSTYTYKFSTNLRNVGTYTGDTMTIEECFGVISCLDNFSSSTVNTSWGCPDQICETKSRTAIVRLSSSIPYITPTHTYKKGCYGGYDTLVVRLINTGGFTASSVKFDLATGYSSYTTDRSDVAGYIDTSSFKFYKPKATPTSTSPSSIAKSIYTKSYFPIAKHPYRAYVNLPNILAGDTLYFEALIYRACLNYDACGSYNSTAANYDISFTKECVSGANYSLPARIVANHEGKRGSGDIDGPTDLSNGDTATFQFCFSSISGHNFDLDQSKGFLRLKYQMPRGLIWTKKLSDLTLTNGTTSTPPDSTYLDSATNTLHIFYKYTSSIARGGRAEYCINPKFYLNCNSPGATGGTNNLSVEALDNFKPSCAGSCEIPYVCKTNFLYNAHCPSPCIRGGFNPKRAFINRTNYGLPDNNEDGLPDATGSLNYAAIQTDRVVARDTFLLTYSGNVVRGVQSPDTFRYGYGTIKYPNNGNLVTHKSTQVKIWDASTNTTFTVSNVSASYATSGSTRTFALNYSPKSGTVGYPTGYFFDNGDSITIEASFIFNANVTRTSDLVNVVENFFYLSHYANPTNDTAKYRCDKWNAKLKTTDAYYTVWSPEVDVVDGCKNYVANYRSYLSIGECCSNYSTSSYFSKEYRSYAVTDSLRIIIPSGYKIDSANIRFDHGAKISKVQYFYRYSLSPIRVKGDTAVYYIGNLYSNNAGTVVPSRGGYVQNLFVTFSPSCAVPPNVSLPRKYDIYLKGINSWNGYNYNWQNYGTGDVKFVSPVVSITNQGTVVSDGAKRVISWDVKLQNDASTAAAEQAWLAFNKPGSGIVIDSVRDIATNQLLPVTNGIYRAGKLNGGGNTNARSFKVFAVFNSCVPDSIKAYGGWNCLTYPTSFTRDVCNIDSTILIVTPVTAVLQLDTLKAIKNSVQMCEQLEFIMSVSQRDLASAYNNTLDVQLPRGLSIVTDSSYILNRANNSKTWFNPSNLGSNKKRFNVSANVAAIGTNGLAEFANAPANEYQLRVKIAIDCNFESGSKLEFEANGTAPCGITLQPARYVQQINIVGAPAVTYQVPELRIQGDTLWGCSDSLNIQSVYHNYDTSSSSVGNKFRVTLPAGFSYIPNSTTFSRNAFSTSQPTISYSFGQQVLNWASAGSTPSKDSSIWSFKITSGSSACGTQEIVADITEDFVATCVTNGAICSSTSIVNSTAGFVHTAKADIVFAYAELQLFQDTFNTSKKDSMTLYIQLYNQGIFKTALVIQAYQDVNNNRLIDGGDILRYDSSIANINAKAGSILTIPITAANSTLSCKMLYRVIAECACSDTIITQPACNVLRLPIALTKFEVIKSSIGIAKVTWTTHTEVNAQLFNIERSTDGKNFSKVGSINASGNNDQEEHYTYFDNFENSAAQTLYYRLRTIDFSETSYYSPIRSLNINQFNIRLFPNPANEKLSIITNLHTGTIIISDLIGSNLISEQLSTNGNTINIQSLRSGIYIMSIQENGTNIHQQKIVVSH